MLSRDIATVFAWLNVENRSIFHPQLLFCTKNVYLVIGKHFPHHWCRNDVSSCNTSYQCLFTSSLVDYRLMMFCEGPNSADNAQVLVEAWLLFNNFE